MLGGSNVMLGGGAINVMLGGSIVMLGGGGQCYVGGGRKLRACYLIMWLYPVCFIAYKVGGGLWGPPCSHTTGR